MADAPADISQTIERPAPVIESIPHFRRYQQSVTTYSIPETRENRKLTDVAFVITLAVCIIVFVPLLIYAAVKSDLRRLINGYDKCGNICGVTNEKVSGIPCSGQDKTNTPFLEYKYEYHELPIPIEYDGIMVPDKCVKSCQPSYIEGFNRCYPPDTDVTPLFSKATYVIHNRLYHFIGLCFIGLGFAIALLLIFRFFTKFTVWLTLISAIIIFIALPSYFWYAYDNYEKNTDLYLSLGILFTIIGFCLVIILVSLLKRINEIVCIFQETLKIIFTIPLILIQPLLTFICNGIIVALFIYFNMVTISCGNLEKVDTDQYDYIADFAMVMAFLLNYSLAYWMLQFVFAFQHMLIAGAVSAIYFSKNTLESKSPIYDSFYNLIRFHLGTTAFGSMVITVAQILKVVLKGLVESDYAICFICCLRPYENLIKYLSTLAYVETAIHGQPFCKSTRRGLILLGSNLITAIVVNSVSDFVLYLTQLLVVSLTVIVGLLMDDGTDYYWVIIVLGSLQTFVFIYSFFVAFQVSLQTLFLCFCEDQDINDGVERPYYTSLGFMKYIDAAQELEQKRLERQEERKKKKKCCRNKYYWCE